MQRGGERRDLGAQKVSPSGPRFLKRPDTDIPCASMVLAHCHHAADYFRLLRQAEPREGDKKILPPRREVAGCNRHAVLPFPPIAPPPVFQPTEHAHCTTLFC